MNTLIISDLDVTAELDNKSMRNVRGGQITGMVMPAMPSLNQFKLGDGFTIGASQLINQGLTIENVVGENTAFATNTSNVSPHQSANNSITLV